MEYSTSALAQLAGLSGRTLRYYDQIGLLRPTRTANGYRRYGPKELARLQQILFYREAGLELDEISKILDNPAFNAAEALEKHLRSLHQRRNQLDALIKTAQKTLGALKGENSMSDTEKFEAFKKNLVDENEAQYGQEVRQRWGSTAADAANAKMMNMTEEEYARFAALGEQLNDTLRQAVPQGQPGGELGQKAAALHKQWLCFTWPQYSAEAHQNLCQMYVDDERFAAYYENITPGAATFLRDAVHIYCQHSK